jgi:hypothetical protein
LVPPARAASPSSRTSNFEIDLFADLVLEEHPQTPS